MPQPLFNTSFIIFNTRFIIFNTQFIIFNTKFIIFNTKSIIFNTKIIVFYRWGYENLQEVIDVADGFAQNGLPLDTVWIDIDYMDSYKIFTNDPVAFPMCTFRAFIDRLHGNGQKIVVIVCNDDEFCIKNKELCIKNKELCIKNMELCINNDGFVRWTPELKSSRGTPHTRRCLRRIYS